jgi:hypothetical protein
MSMNFGGSGVGLAGPGSGGRQMGGAGHSTQGGAPFAGIPEELQGSVQKLLETEPCTATQAPPSPSA